jgi:hypothetical protein
MSMNPTHASIQTRTRVQTVHAHAAAGPSEVDGAPRQPMGHEASEGWRARIKARELKKKETDRPPRGDRPPPRGHTRPSAHTRWIHHITALDVSPREEWAPSTLDAQGLLRAAEEAPLLCC